MQQIASYQKTTGGVLVFNEKGQIVLSNASVNQLFGYDADELLSMNIQQLIPTGPAKRHRDATSIPSLLKSPPEETISSVDLRNMGINWRWKLAYVNSGVEMNVLRRHLS